MQKKVIGTILGCIVIIVVGLFLINKTTKTTQPVQTAEVNTEVESTDVPTIEPTAIPEPTVEPTAEPTVAPEATPELTAVPTVTPEATPELIVVETTPAPSAEPAPTATPKPNVTVKTEADKQAELQADTIAMLEALGATSWEDAPKSDRAGNTKGYHGDGTHFGDLQ